MTLLIFFLTAIVGGTGSPLIKHAVEIFPPMSFIFLRGILSSILILPFAYKEIKNPKPHKKLLFISTLLFAANWVFFALGIQRTTVLMGQAIYIPTGIIVAIIGFIFLKEKLTREQISGLVITLLGLSVLIVGSVKGQDLSSVGTPLGNLLVVGGLLSWASFTVVSRKISAYYSTFGLTIINFATTAVLALAIMPLVGESPTSIPVNSSSVVSILSVTAGTTAFFLLYQYLIKNTSAFLASLVIYPVSVFGALGGIIFYGEKLTPAFVTGSALIVLGVFTATSYQYAKKYIRWPLIYR
ncbi:MAG: DMT family transporter [Candidatus Curtissbacteria bacterium]|nr:DMT family transporter [Candidatus Curtissbacteria bacterium]